eukprot:10115834-Lingulodinium_polyedra.AAC.1
MSQALRHPHPTGDTPLNTQEANARTAAHAAPRRRISALRARTFALSETWRPQGAFYHCLPVAG